MNKYIHKTEAIMSKSLILPFGNEKEQQAGHDHRQLWGKGKIELILNIIILQICTEYKRNTLKTCLHLERDQLQQSSDQTEIADILYLMT